MRALVTVLAQRDYAEPVFETRTPVDVMEVDAGGCVAADYGTTITGEEAGSNGLIDSRPRPLRCMRIATIGLALPAPAATPLRLPTEMLLAALSAAGSAPVSFRNSAVNAWRRRTDMTRPLDPNIVAATLLAPGPQCG